MALTRREFGKLVAGVAVGAVAPTAVLAEAPQVVTGGLVSREMNGAIVWPPCLLIPGEVVVPRKAITAMSFEVTGEPLPDGAKEKGIRGIIVWPDGTREVQWGQ